MILNEVIIDIAAGPFGSNLKVECFVPEGFPIIDGANLKGFKVTDNITKFVTEEKARSLHRSIAKRGDVVSTISGTIGQIAYIPDDSKYEEYLVSQRQFRITFDTEKINVPFLVYYFHSRIGQSKIFAFANQVGVPALAQPLKNFRNIEVDFPPIDVQNKIASILSSLDDKIAVNKKICENLEAQAQALFKHWFVDFAPFKDGKFVESELGLIPEGWRVASLSSIADYVNGLAMQKFRPEKGEEGLYVLKIKELGQGGFDANSELCSPSKIGDKYTINDGDIIFSWSGTLMVKIWCGGKCGLNQHLFNVVPNDYPKWFVYLWTRHHLDNFIRIAKDKAVTMGHIKRGELDKAMVLIPSDEDLNKIDALLAPIHQQIVNGELESRRLSALRDTLLPKLMSGEIKVNEIEI